MARNAKNGAKGENAAKREQDVEDEEDDDGSEGEYEVEAILDTRKVSVSYTTSDQFQMQESQLMILGQNSM